VTESLTRTTGEIVSSSQHVMAAADEQRIAIEITAGAVTDMSASTAVMAEGAGRLSQSATNVSTVISQTRRAINVVAGNSDAFEASTAETASSVHEMITGIREISQGLERLAASTERIAPSVTEVAASTREIEQHANESVELGRAGVGRCLRQRHRRGRRCDGGDRAYPLQRRVACRRDPVSWRALPGHRFHPDHHR